MRPRLADSSRKRVRVSGRGLGFGFRVGFRVGACAVRVWGLADHGEPQPQPPHRSGVGLRGEKFLSVRQDVCVGVCRATGYKRP